jgi:hypothetical protein
MAAYIFNQADGTLLRDISPLWVGSATYGDNTTFDVQSSKLQAVGGSIFALKEAYLNESGSTYAIAKFAAGSNNDYRAIICSSSGTIADGYYLSILGTSCYWARNGVFQSSYTIPGGHNANTTNTEVKIEKVGSTINLYVGPIGSPVLVDNPTDGSPISGGFSGFWFNSGASVTCGVISFDNGVAAATTIYEFSTFSRGVGRGIARGIA